MIKMSNKFPPNDELKLVIACHIETFYNDGNLVLGIDDNPLLGTPPRNAETNVAEYALKLMHHVPDYGYRSVRKKMPKKDLIVVTTDNTVIRYRVNPLKLGSAKIMQKYKAPENSKYMYIGAIECNGMHFDMGDNAVDVFNRLQRLSHAQVQIIKISTNYCLPATKPYTVLDKDIDKHLVECSKNPETFYDEYMRFMPYESSTVKPDGTVTGSVCPAANYPVKNAYMVNNPFWYDKMLQWDLPHHWDHVDYEYYEEGPVLENPFGTVEAL